MLESDKIPVFDVTSTVGPVLTLQTVFKTAQLSGARETPVAVERFSHELAKVDPRIDLLPPLKGWANTGQRTERNVARRVLKSLRRNTGLDFTDRARLIGVTAGATQTGLTAELEKQRGQFVLRLIANGRSDRRQRKVLRLRATELDAAKTEAESVIRSLAASLNLRPEQYTGIPLLRDAH